MPRLSKPCGATDLLTRRTFTKLKHLEDYFDRYKYLRIGNQRPGERTFGGDRWLNQRFYASSEWKSVREEVIARDQGYDMGHRDYPIKGKIYVHHMNPMDVQMLKDGEITILDPEYLISVSMMTHEAIHFGDSGLLPKPHVERVPGDTLLWGKRRNDRLGGR